MERYRGWDAHGLQHAGFCGSLTEQLEYGLGLLIGDLQCQLVGLNENLGPGQPRDLKGHVRIADDRFG